MIITTQSNDKKTISKEKKEEYQKALKAIKDKNTDIREVRLEAGDDLVEVLKSIGKDTAVKALYLYPNQIGVSRQRYIEIAQLAKFIRKNTHLETLSLENNSITAEEAKQLAKALIANTKLKSLNLDGNNLGDEGAEAFAGAMTVAHDWHLKPLPANTSLVSLSVANNQIKSKGAEALGNASYSNDSFKALSIGFNPIGGSGIKNIIFAHFQELDLSTIDMSYIKIDDLIFAFTGMNHIKKLNLRSTKQSDYQVLELAKALETNTSLEILLLDGNLIKDLGLKYLSKMLKINTTLETLGLSSCKGVTINGIKTLINALDTSENTKMKDVALPIEHLNEYDTKEVISLINKLHETKPNIGFSLDPNPDLSDEIKVEIKAINDKNPKYHETAPAKEVVEEAENVEEVQKAKLTLENYGYDHDQSGAPLSQAEILARAKIVEYMTPILGEKSMKCFKFYDLGILYDGVSKVGDAAVTHDPI